MSLASAPRLLLVTSLAGLTLAALSTPTLRAQPARETESRFSWSSLPPLPDKHGFAGPFVGAHNNKLLVAGGANFPDLPPWKGGTKVWYDTVFLFSPANQTWSVAGRLPRPLGYGVSLSVPAGILCIGGSNSHGHFSDTFLLKLDGEQPTIKPMPSLPLPCANFCGALVGNIVYICGGTEKPDSREALRTLWSLDLALPDSQWRELEPIPGPGRILAVAASQDDSFYVMSGAELMPGADGKPARRYLKDGYSYRPHAGWRRLSDLPRAAVAAPSPAATSPGEIIIISGDDGTHVGYQPPEHHPGFAKSILSYDVRTDRWNHSDRWNSTSQSPIAPVTTTIVNWRGSFIVPSGETSPGIRTPAIWALQVAATKAGPTSGKFK